MKWVGWRGLSQLGVCLEQASKGGRSSRSHWGQVSEEEAQPSPGWAGPTRQASGCCLDLGGAKEQGWRGCGGQGPKGLLKPNLLKEGWAGWEGRETSQGRSGQGLAWKALGVGRGALGWYRPARDG